MRERDGSPRQVRPLRPLMPLGLAARRIHDHRHPHKAQCGSHGVEPIVGLVITLIIFKIVWESGQSLFSRLLDGVDPEVIDEVTHSAQHVPEVLEVTEVRVRWIGHRLLADVNIAVKADLSVEQGHEIAREVRHQLLHHLRTLAMPRFTSILPRHQANNIIELAILNMTNFRRIHTNHAETGQRQMAVRHVATALPCRLFVRDTRRVRCAGAGGLRDTKCP